MSKLACILLLEMSALLCAQTGNSDDRARVEVAKLLRNLRGTWSVTDTYEPSPSMPHGGHRKGTEIWGPGPGDRSVIEQYRSEDDFDNPSTAFGLGWWDEDAGGFRFDWCSSDDPHGCIRLSEAARWEADAFVIRHKTIENGQPSEMREVFGDFTPSSFTQTIYQGPPGNLKKFLTVKAKRVQW